MKPLKEDKKYNTSKGITLIPLLITVLMVLIIAGVMIGNGLQSSDNARLQSFFAELQVIQKRVDVIAEEARTGSNDKIQYDPNTQLYQSEVGENVQDIRDKEKLEKIEYLKNNKEIYNYTLDDYVQSGKIFHLDGIQNLKNGEDKTSVKWEDLSSNEYPIELFHANWDNEHTSLYLDRTKQAYMKIQNPVKACNQFTIEILIKPINSQTWGAPIITFDTENENTAPRLAITNENPQNQYQWINGGIFASGEKVLTMNLNTIHLISIVVDNDKASLYDNGNLVYQQSKLTDATIERLRTDYINIANVTRVSQNFFNGNIFAIRMYDYALAQGQVGKNYLIDTIRFSDQDMVIEKRENKIVNDYFYYTKEQLEELGIGDINQDILINWETRDVISVDGFTANGKTYYRDPSVFKPQYQEQTKQKLVLNENNIKKTGEAIKQIEIQNLQTEEGKQVNKFEVRYRLKNYEQENEWLLAKQNTFQTAIPGTYEIQVSRRFD